MDNATSNDALVECMRTKLKEWRSYLMNEKFLQFRCVAHIINLVVFDGMKEVGLAVERVRDCVKWVKSSRAWIEKFKYNISFIEMDGRRFVSLDVPTWWNSTYLMLESAERFEVVFNFMHSSPNGASF
ncbi:unnamed protein product [Linum tenue]|uniref:Transposase n=1 Tax=Linum tenue TaxID=586396 RepID=A0AAV0Q437_9ROSI|nr:unnamed protein product [Linum tenue]